MNNSLISSVLHQHQGLSIRSEIQKTLKSLRENNFTQYLSELKAFFTVEDIRFHIWLLVISQLAKEENPTEDEWQIVKPLLNTNIEFTTNFLEALHSEGWLQYLIRHGYLQSFLTSPDDRIFNLVIWKLKVFIDLYTDTAIDFIVEFPEIKNRNECICSILLELSHWENPKAVQLFEHYLPTFTTFSERHPYYRILKSVFPYQPARICEIFFKELTEKVNAIPSVDEFEKQNVFDYEEIDLFQKFLEKEELKRVAVTKGLTLIRLLVEKTTRKTEYEFSHDRAFLFFDSFGGQLYNHWTFFSLIRKQLMTIAQDDESFFLELTAGFETSHAFTLLKLLIQGYLTSPEKYREKGFQLLTRTGVLTHLSDENTGGYEVRSLLHDLYSSLSSKQKEHINTMILEVSPDWERKDVSKYRLLCAIPRNELTKYPSLEKHFHELHRTFGPYEEKPPEVKKVITVGAPLPDVAYEKMTMEQWLSSFKRYDESTKWEHPGEHLLQGGIVEHSRRFTDEVAKQPEDFYDFIFSLGDRDGISLIYLEAGINGLVKAQYDIEKIKTLIKAYWRYSDSGFRRSIIWAIDYVNKQDALDLDLLSILEEYVLNDPDPNEESWTVDAGGGTPYYGGDPLNSGINTVRGSAVSRLAIHGYKTNYPDKVFEIMQQAAADPAISVRCCLISDLQGMLRWDHNKTYHIFMRLTQEQHPQVIKYGLSCLAYLMNEENFQTFIPHLKIAMGLDERVGYEHIQEYLGQILMLAYIRNYPKSRELFEQGLQFSEHIKTGAVNFASKNLLDTNSDVVKKSEEIYLRFLDEESEEVSRMYDHVFYQFEPENFNRLHHLMTAYTQSRAVSHAGHHFFDYLLKCVETEPEKCLELLQNYLNHAQVEGQKRSFAYRDTPVQVLIRAYNTLSDDAYREQAMDIFDRMLQDQNYKREGLKILEELDRE